MSAGPATEAVRVLYVGGVPRSGSTLTDLVLDQLPGHVSVGELFYLFRNGIRMDSACGCGEPFSACPFWVAVGDRAVGGWANLTSTTSSPCRHGWTGRRTCRRS